VDLKLAFYALRSIRGALSLLATAVFTARLVVISSTPTATAAAAT
jgi:hypothetical protein